MVRKHSELISSALIKLTLLPRKKQMFLPRIVMPSGQSVPSRQLKDLLVQRDMLNVQVYATKHNGRQGCAIQKHLPHWRIFSTNLRCNAPDLGPRPWFAPFYLRPKQSHARQPSQFKILVVLVATRAGGPIHTTSFRRAERLQGCQGGDPSRRRTCTQHSPSGGGHIL